MIRRGFSLIELMIVVSVIGISGGIALFTMSDQIADARAKSEGLALLQEVRLAHRVAKEQMRGLRIKSVPGATNQVIFQGTKSNDCDKEVGDAKVVEFKLARLDLSTPRACFNDRGEIDNAASAGSGVGLPPSQSAAISVPLTDPDPVRMAITSGGRPERTMSRGLRIDKATINQETLVYRGTDGDDSVAEPNIGFLEPDVLTPVSTNPIGSE